MSVTLVHSTLWSFLLLGGFVLLKEADTPLRCRVEPKQYRQLGELCDVCLALLPMLLPRLAVCHN